MSVFTTEHAPFFIESASASDATLSAGYTELLPTATDASYTLPTPYVGLEITAFCVGTATAVTVVCPSGVTINAQGDDTITMSGENEYVQLMGKSSTRYVLVGHNGIVVSGA